MRDPRHTRRYSWLLTTRGWMVVAAVALVGMIGTARAETPRVPPLDEASRDSRIDPVLGLMMQRAYARRALPARAVPLVPGDETGGLANSGALEIGPQTPVALLIEGTADRTQLELQGATVGTVAGDVITATAPIGLVPDILAVPGVDRISAAARVEPVLNVSVPETDADVLWQGTPPSYPAGAITGRNVVVGIVDTGVDPRHSDFKDASGATRFKYAWDQTWTGTPPPGFGYGVEYSASQINAGQVTYYKDTDGHGTHVAGIAVGNGQATGNGRPAWQYVGVAPRADIIAVKALLYESQVIDAVNYVFQRAAALQRPAVVNLSLSVTMGAHDGTYAFDRSLSALTGPGKVITAAAGNRGLENGHARIDLASGASTDVSFTIPTYTPNQSVSEVLYVEGWHDGSASFDVKLISPTGLQTVVYAPGSSSGFLETADGTLSIQNDITSNAKGAKQILVMVAYGNAGSAHPRSGTWRINVKRRTGSSSGLGHWWISDSVFPTTVLPAFTGASVDTATTVTSPATGDSVIATGAYTTKVSWINLNNSTGGFAGPPPLYHLADFSSRGPRRDGVQRPDVVAPGYGVMSTMSGDAVVSAYFKDRDGKHYIAKGTSMANAHTTGAVALLMEQLGSIGPSRARLELRTRARADSYTGTTPNGKWGYGKLDLMSSETTAVVDPEPGITPTEIAFRSPYPNPSRDVTSFSFEITPAALTDGPRTPVQVRIVDVNGRSVAELRGAAAPGVQLVTWDGRDNAGLSVPAGVYFAHLQVGQKALYRKFVRAGS
jgi:subtilisin family serine protease